MWCLINGRRQTFKWVEIFHKKPKVSRQIIIIIKKGAKTFKTPRGIARATQIQQILLLQLWSLKLYATFMLICKSHKKLFENSSESFWILIFFFLPDLRSFKMFISANKLYRCNSAYLLILPVFELEFFTYHLDQPEPFLMIIVLFSTFR